MFSGWTIGCTLEKTEPTPILSLLYTPLIVGGLAGSFLINSFISTLSRTVSS